MADEASLEVTSRNPLPDLIEWILSTDDKIKRKKNHLVEVIWNHRNETGNLQHILPQLRELEETFSGHATIKAEFREFRETVEKRCTELKDKIEKLDVILKEVHTEGEKAKRFTGQAQNIDPESLLSIEDKKEFRSLKQEANDWYDNIQLKFKEGKKLSLICKGNVEDVSLSLCAWRKLSEVSQEYGQKFAQATMEAEIKERQMREQIIEMECDASGLKVQNSTLDDQVKKMKDKILEAEGEFLIKQALHEEIVGDLRDKLTECQEKLSEEKRSNFEMEIEIGKIKEKLKEVQFREESGLKQIEVFEERNKELEGKIVSLRESVLEGERLREETEKLVLEIQEELQDLDEEGEERDTLGKQDDNFKRVYTLVKTLKKRTLEENDEGTIEHLESEGRSEGDCNKENVKEIEKSLSTVEREQKSNEERGRLIEMRREDAEERLFEIQSELQDLDEEEEGTKNDVGRVNILVKTLKKRLENNEQYIENLETKIRLENHRSEEHVVAIEKLLRKVESEEKGKDERDKVIDTIRGLLEENEKYSAQLESENEGLRNDIAAERQRIAKLQETVEDLKRNGSDFKCKICHLENAQTCKLKLKDMESREELSQKKIQMLEDRKNKLDGDVETLQKNLFEAKRGKETAEKLLLEIQRELQDLDEEYGEEKTKHSNDGFMRVDVLVFMLKRKLQDSKGAIEILESEIQGKRIRNQENTEEIEKRLSKVGLLERSGEEQRLLRGLLDENEKLAAHIETQNKALNAGIAAERQRVMELRDRVEHLQQSISDEKRANFEMEMETKKLRNQIEDEQSKNDLSLKKIELMQKEIIVLLDTIKGKVEMIEQLRSDNDRVKEKLEVERKRNEDNSQRIVELQNKMVFKENTLEETEAEVKKMTAELKHTKEKLESVDIELGWIKENNDLPASDVLKEKDRNLQEDYASERSTQVEYLIKCKMLKKRISLTESGNTENTRVAEMAEVELQKESEKEKALQQLRHSEEMTETLEDGQGLVRELEAEADKERLRASTIEAMMASDNGKSAEEKSVIQDLKSRVEEYQKTVNDIKSKVDKINRQLNCTSPGSHQAEQMSSTDVSVKRINERLPSHSSSHYELKASVSAAEETSESIKAEIKTQTDKNNRQDQNIDNLLRQSVEYDRLVADAKSELDEIRKRYHELSGQLAPEEKYDPTDARTESPTTLVRSMPEYELSKQLSSFEELLETIFADEAHRIEQLQNKLDDVFNKNVEFSTILCEMTEEERFERQPWTREDLRKTLTTREERIDKLQSALEKEEITKDGLEKKMAAFEEQLNHKELAALQLEIREGEKSIFRPQKELAEERECNFDLQERVIKEMQCNLEESGKKFDEIQIQAKESGHETSQEFALEKSKKEKRVTELEDELIKLREKLEKEQNYVFELTESLEFVRDQCTVKDNAIDEMRKVLEKDKERSEEIRKLLDEAEDRTMRLSEALTNEQVRGMEQEKAIQHLKERINEEQRRLRETRDALDEEIQLVNQLKERLSVEQLMKSEFERELDRINAKFAEEHQTQISIQEQLQRDKNIIYETEHLLRQQQDDAGQSKKMIEELKTDLETERTCYEMLSERLVSEQRRIVELEMQLKETEAIMRCDKDMLDSLRQRCSREEEIHFNLLEKLEKAEKLNKEKDEEIYSLINELATEKMKIDGLLTSLEDKNVSKAHLDERVTELEEVIARDELLFQELRVKIDSEVDKNRELVEKFDKEKVKSSIYKERIRELETQVSQDGELFEELKRTIDIERGQSRRLDAMLHEERSETTRRHTVLTEFEQLLLSERKSKDELKGYLESEIGLSDSDVHEKLRLGSEGKEIEKTLAEELKVEFDERFALEETKVRALESKLEAEQFKAFENEKAKQSMQKELEEKDYWLKQIAEELANDIGEESQSSTDESESRCYDKRDNTKKLVFDEPKGGNSQFEDLLGKIIAGRNARKRVKHKAKERKRRMAEKEKLIEDINRRHEDETRRMKEENVSRLEQQVAFLKESENRLKIFTDERDGYRKDFERIRDELENERSRRNYFEVLSVEQQKKNQSLDEMVECLKNKVTEGCEQINSTTQQLEKQMKESEEEREENKRLREMCETQDEKMEKLKKELENYKIIYQEKDFFSKEMLQQVEELRKQLEELEHDIDQRNRPGEVRQRSRFVEATSTSFTGVDSKEVIKGLRKELENIREVIHNNVSELESVRIQLREKEEENTKLRLENEKQQKSVQSLRDMQDRSEKAEWQLSKLQLTYNLLVNDVEMKKCLVAEANNEASRLRGLLAEKDTVIHNLKENAKSSLEEKEKIISDLRENAKTSLREKERIILEMKKKAEASKRKDVCANENEIEKLRMILKQKEEHIQDINNEHKSELSRRDAEVLDVHLSLDIMSTVYQGLQAEKEREDVVRNAAERTQRKSKEDLHTATAMVRDLQRQICDVQAEVFDEKQLARSLDEENPAAKLPNESEKSYLKRRSSLRNILSFQIDEKEKKIKRLKTLVNTIESRYGKQLFGIVESSAVTDEEENQVGSSWEQTEKSPLPRSQVQEALSVTKGNMRALASTDLLREEDSMEKAENKRETKEKVEMNSTGEQRNYDKTQNEQTSSLLSKRKILVVSLLGVIVGTTPFCASSTVTGFLLAFVIIPLVFLLSAHQSRGTEKNGAMLQKALSLKEEKERAYLDKIEEMRIRNEGDCNLIQELKKQLEDELTEKEAIQMKLDEIMVAKESVFDSKEDIEDFDTKMQREIEKAKLLEAEKRKKAFEEYKTLREEVDRLKRDREAELNKNQSRFAGLEQVAVISDEKGEYGIKRVNVPLSVLPVCLGISVGLWQLMGCHFTAPYIILSALVTFTTNSWYSEKNVVQRLTEQRQNYEEQHQELDEMTQLLDTQFEVVKSQKSAIDMLVKEIEKEQLERREKRNTFAKLIWQLQEMDGMQNLIAKESSRTFGATTGLEVALRTKAEEKALERARFYNNMIATLKEISADEIENRAMTDDLCQTAQKLADYAEDQLEEQKRREIEENRRRVAGKKRVDIPWETISLATVHAGALAASIALQSYIVAGLVALQAFIYGLQRRDGSRSRHARSEEVDQLKMQLRRESARSKSLQAETEKLKALLETEKTYKISDEFVLEIKEKRKVKKSRVQRPS